MSDTDTTTDAATTDTTTTADPPKAPEGYLSPEQVNKVVQDRLARDRRERPSDEEIEAWRESATKLQEIEDANKSELERAQKAAAEASEREQKATARANTALRRQAIVSAAAQAGADPDIVHALLADKGFKCGDIEVSVGDDGEVANAKDAVEKLIEEKNLGGTPPAPPGDGGARGEPVQTKDLDEQIVEARRKGDYMREMDLNNVKLMKLREEEKAAA